MKKLLKIAAVIIGIIVIGSIAAYVAKGRLMNSESYVHLIKELKSDPSVLEYHGEILSTKMISANINVGNGTKIAKYTVFIDGNKNDSTGIFILEKTGEVWTLIGGQQITE